MGPAPNGMNSLEIRSLHCEILLKCDTRPDSRMGTKSKTAGLVAIIVWIGGCRDAVAVQCCADGTATLDRPLPEIAEQASHPEQASLPRPPWTNLNTDEVVHEFKGKHCPRDTRRLTLYPRSCRRAVDTIAAGWAGRQLDGRSCSCHVYT